MLMKLSKNLAKPQLPLGWVVEQHTQSLVTTDVANKLTDNQQPYPLGSQASLYFGGFVLEWSDKLWQVFLYDTTNIQEKQEKFFEKDTHILVYFQDEIPILALVMLDMSDLAHLFT